MKKLVIFLILIAAAGGAAFWYFKYGKTEEKPQVIQATVSRGDIIEVVSATGTLEPWRRVDVGSQVSGVVQELFVDYNSIVTEGQVLRVPARTPHQLEALDDTLVLDVRSGDASF